MRRAPPSHLPDRIERDEHPRDESSEDDHAKDDGIRVTMDSLEHTGSHLLSAGPPAPDDWSSASSPLVACALVTWDGMTLPGRCGHVSCTRPI